MFSYIGTLSTVSGVQAVQTDANRILLSFTPPDTLEGVPILNYSLVLLGKTHWSDDNSTVLTLGDYCMNHTVTITPYNGLGPGEPFNYTLLQYEGNVPLMLPFQVNFTTVYL